MAPGVMVTVSKSEKVLWVRGGKTEDNFICEDHSPVTQGTSNGGKLHEQRKFWVAELLCSRGFLGNKVLLPTLQVTASSNGQYYNHHHQP